MHAKARKTRTRNETLAVPAHEQLRALTQRTRLSNAQDIRVENFFVFFSLLHIFALIGIVSYGLAHFAVYTLDLHAPGFAGQVSTCITLISAVFMLATVEQHKPGYLCRIFWQCTLFSLGWPRRFQRTHIHETFEVPLDLSFDHTTSQLTWIAHSEHESLVHVRRGAQLHDEDPPTYSAHALNNGSLDFTHPLTCIEWTRDPNMAQRTCLHLQDHKGQCVDLIFDAPDLIPAQTCALLPSLEREGIEISHKEQPALWNTLVETLKATSPSSPAVRLMTARGVWSEAQRRTLYAYAFQPRTTRV